MSDLVAVRPPELEPIDTIERLADVIGIEAGRLYRVSEIAGRHYRPFDLRKPGTPKWRHIDNPVGELRTIQRRLYEGWLSKIELPDQVMGGVRGRSVHFNAEAHVGSREVVAMDLRDCFARVTHTATYRALVAHAGASPRVARIVTKLTTVQHRLPQGSPTSMALAAITMLPLYATIDTIATEHGLTWTVYVDDFVFSGGSVRDAIEPIVRAIQRAGHAVRRSKTRVMSREEPQVVTGQTVNEERSLPRARRELIFRRIHDLASRERVTAHELSSLWGQIKNVRAINAGHGARLAAIAERLLPSEGAPGQPESKFDYRKCRDASRHAIHGARSSPGGG